MCAWMTQCEEGACVRMVRLQAGEDWIDEMTKCTQIYMCGSVGVGEVVPKMW